MTNYEAAREKYAALGVDTDKAIETLKKVPVSLHCWQLDDVIGFDNDGGLTGGIQTTGNYMGRARTPEQLMADMEEAMRLMPGTAKLNIHASYAIFAPGEFADRDALEPKHFAKWVEFAKKHHMGIDFNPTFFSHEKVKDGQTLSSLDEETRRFWINHGKACIRISEYFAKETGMPCVMNIWTGDGFKDVPADRMGPRMRYKDSIEQILSEPYDHNLVKPCVESKVFGIGVESYTVGSAEFTLSFAALHDGCMPLMDNGHYHPLEYADLLDQVKEIMNRYDLPEGLVQIEITESVGDMDIVLINNIAQSLISMGFRLSMDDFGTKYSNLEMLFKFPFSIAKIDRSLVKNLESNEKSRIMLKHLISMIMELGIECVAEGAENEEQVRLLQQFGCNIIQGYFYSKPVTLDVFTSEFVEKTRNQL